MSLYWTVAVASADQFHTLTSPVPSPVKNMPLGPIWIARTSCLVNILPLSANLKRNGANIE